jgi:transposase InsO family protein
MVHEGAFSEMMRRKGAAPGEDACFLVRKLETAEPWHRRMGHAGYENLAKMVQDDLVEGVGVKPSAFRALKTSVCEPCIIGKQTRQPFPESESVSTEPLELVHMDVCKPMPVPSIGGSRYFATFLDDYSKLSVVVPMKQKSEVAKVTEWTINRLELQLGKKLKSVRTDRGKEYVNKALENVFGGKGTVHEKTAPYTAKQNGSAERLNRQLEDKVRAMLDDLRLPKELWAEAVVTANYTRNRTPVSAHGMTPWEAFFGKKPKLGHIRVFGARAFAHVPKQRRRKLDPVSERGVFVGYEPDSKAYRVLRESDRKLIIRRDVIFYEGANGEGAVELSSDLMKDSPEAAEGGAQDPIVVRRRPFLDLTRQDPLEQVGAPNPKTGQLGVFSDLERQAGTEPDEMEVDPGIQPPAAQRYPMRERRAPGEWYRANSAANAKAGEHPKGTGGHPERPEPQSYQEAVGEEESDL